MNTSTFVETATLATERAMEYVSTTGGVISKARSLVAGDAQFFSVAPKIDDLRRGLAADSVFEKRDAMKRIVAQMCKGNDMHCLFPDVVKNIHVASIELRKLVYLFVVTYADVCPNEALLSISAFQKDLVDPSMHVRALALRMLSSMRIPTIHPVVMLAVRKCTTDSAPVVRKTAAISLVQMASVSKKEVDPGSIRDVLQTLLKDRNADVVGAAVMSFSKICPHALELLHPVYRHLCEKVLEECEEWGQVVLLRVLLRYARTFFCDPTQPYPGKRQGDAASSSDGDGESSDSDFSSSSSSSSSARPSRGANRPSDEMTLDEDHQLLLNSVKPLLMSINAAVVIGACAVFYHAAPPRYLEYCVRPLIRVLRCSSTASKSAVLNVIYSVLLSLPTAFVPYVKEFYLLPQDVADVRELKLRILSRLVTPQNALDVFQELRAYVRNYSAEYVVEAVRALGLIATRHPECTLQTMRLLTPLLSHRQARVVEEAVRVLQLLVIQGKDTTHTSRLVFRLMMDATSGKITTPAALATVVWLVGESTRLYPAVAAAAPDCFRVFARQFAQLDGAVKQEVLTLGCKIWLHLDGTSELAERFKKLYLYVMELAQYDENYLIRDQARMLRCAEDRQSEAFTALRAALLCEKPMPEVSDPFAERSEFEMGTLSHFFGHHVFDYEPLPPWSTTAPDTSLRAPPKPAAAEAFESSSASSSYTASSASSYSDDDDTASGSDTGSHSSSDSGNGEDEQDENGRASAHSSSSSGSSSSSPSSSMSPPHGTAPKGAPARPAITVKIAVRPATTAAGVTSATAATTSITAPLSPSGHSATADAARVTTTTAITSSPSHQSPQSHSASSSPTRGSSPLTSDKKITNVVASGPPSLPPDVSEGSQSPSTS